MELARFEYSPCDGDHSLTLLRSPASIRVTFEVSRTALEEACPGYNPKLETTRVYSPSALARASPIGPPPTITTSRSDSKPAELDNHRLFALEQLRDASEVIVVKLTRPSILKLAFQ